MSSHFANPLKRLEASTRIELVYTDLQSSQKSKQNKGDVFQNTPRQTVNFTGMFQTLD